MPSQLELIREAPPAREGTVNNRPYQNDCLRSNVKAVMAGMTSGINALPTGAGKTIVLAQLARWLAHNGCLPKDSSVLILAHRDELITQTREKLLRVNPNAKIGIEKGEQYVEDLSVTYVIASVQTIGREESKRLERLKSMNIGLIITDEAHHASAETYQRIYKAFPKALHIGFTATPYRGDGQKLTDVYQDIFFEVKLRWMIEQGWLARPKLYQRMTGVSLAGVTIRKGEYAAQELENAVNTPERNQLVVDAYKTWGENERALVFAAGIEHGSDLRNAFLDSGVETRFIDGETPLDERKAILSAFKEGSVKVLVNVGVLTEGFDEPLIKSVILARPTRSPLLYAQMIGRVLRIPEIGDVSPELREILKTANIIDVADSNRKIGTMNALKMFNVDRDIDMSRQPGADILDVVDAVEQQDKRGITADTSEELSKFRVNDKYFEIPVVDRMVRKSSAYLWQRMSNGTMVLTLPNKTKAVIRVDQLGRVQLDMDFAQEKNRVTLGSGEIRDSHITRADELIRERYPNKELLGKVEWRWTLKGPGKSPATENQLGALRKFQIEHKRGITKGEASLLLARVIADRFGDR